MAMPARELRLWLAELDDDDLVAVDDGGLALVAVDNPYDYYIEIGGIPEPEPEGKNDDAL